VLETSIICSGSGKECLSHHSIGGEIDKEEENKLLT
jgi:hypothetical protein